MMFARCSICLAGFAALVLLAGCGEEGRSYEVPLAEAHSILLGAEVPTFVFGSAGVVYDVVDEGSRIVWRVNDRKGELMHFAADLEAAGEKATRVRVTLEGPADGPHKDVGKRLEEHGTVKTLYLRAMEEEVASRLEHRPYNVTVIWPAMAAATAAHASQISADLDKVAAESQRRDRENIERAYAEEAAGRR